MLKITNDTEIENFHDIPGVYAYFNGGYITDNDDYIKDHKKDAIGVAVIAEVEDKLHRIVLDKTNISSGYVLYGGYNKSITGATTTKDRTTARQDMKGKENTIAISDACHGYYDGYRTGSAAEDCQAMFDGKGHLPSLGEWQMLYDNKSAINKMMAAIGGTALQEKWYWSSTLYNASPHSWYFCWYNGNTNYYRRYFDFSVRAVMEI